MKKICILSNSHAASLKIGWELIKENYSNVDLTFFAHRGKGLEGLNIQGKCLVPNSEALKKIILLTSRGLDCVNTDSYDFFLLYGLRTETFHYSNIYYSTDVEKKTLSDNTKHTASTVLLKRLREITDKPVYIGHNPLFSATEETTSIPENLYYAWIAKLNNHIYKKHGAILLPQPAETIINGFQTKVAFSKNSRRLDIGDKISNQFHPPSDFRHMNGDFGAIYLKKLIDTVTI